MTGTVPTALADQLRHSEEQRRRDCALASNGRAPDRRRIQNITCRVGGHDVKIEVGQPDPVYGVEVLVILDQGRALPYAVYTAMHHELPTLEIGRHVYSVTDFAA